jgi:hypothetical protein
VESMGLAYCWTLKNKPILHHDSNTKYKPRVWPIARPSNLNQN